MKMVRVTVLTENRNDDTDSKEKRVKETGPDLMVV